MAPSYPCWSHPCWSHLWLNNFHWGLGCLLVKQNFRVIIDSIEFDIFNSQKLKKKLVSWEYVIVFYNKIYFSLIKNMLSHLKQMRYSKLSKYISAQLEAKRPGYQSWLYSRPAVCLPTPHLPTPSPPRSLWDLSSLTRDRTCALSSESAES